MINMRTKCDECKYCVLQDYGYSNYTVEGITADCLLNLNPDFPKDYWYGEEPVLNFAERCQRFAAGEPTMIDTDLELGSFEEYSNDPEIKQLLSSY